jgi:uncharacterized DUF497 family protein
MMNILPDPLAFEWDEGNIYKSVTKHGVTNKEAEEVFVNRPLLVSDDVTHSIKEARHQALGRAVSQKLLYIIFTIRIEKVRIISARLMDKKERSIYEQAEKVQKNTSV